MALRGLALAFLLVLASLLLAWGRKDSDSRNERGAEEPDTCKRPDWGPGLQLTPDQENYKKNEEVLLRCPAGFQPSLSRVKCAGKVQTISNGNRVYREAWNGKNSSDMWISIDPTFRVECLETCQKPHWEPRFIFNQERRTFYPNEVVKMRCPEGYWPPPMEIKCVKLDPEEGSTIPHSSWVMRHGTGHWRPMERNLTCLDVLQVVPGTLEISSTSIKLNWTCRLPDTCQDIWAKCRLEDDYSSPCEAEEVKGEERLYGWKGTFTCPPLEPFTRYSVTISLPPSTILFTRIYRTKETVPDAPEDLQLDPSTGSLGWKALQSCKGEIIGYQLNITARRAQDGSFIDFQQVTVNQSVTQYTPPAQAAGSTYMVTVQGLTAAGAGPASVLEFQSYISVAGQPQGLWSGTAVTVVVVLSVLVLLAVGILWRVLSRKRKALPRKAEEDPYTELQTYENLDPYGMIMGSLLAGEDAGKGGQAGEPLSQPLPVWERPGDRKSSEGAEKGWTSEAQC